MDLQPDMVVMAIIADDFRLTRTPILDSAGYFTGGEFFPMIPADSSARRLVRGIHLTYVVKEIVIRWSRPGLKSEALIQGEVPASYRYVQTFRDLAVTHGIPYLIVLLPQESWGVLSDRLTRDQIAHLDVSFLRAEFTDEQFRASPFDGHPSPAVHLRIGEVLATHIGAMLRP
jgi:hypothetical protein